MDKKPRSNLAVALVACGALVAILLLMVYVAAYLHFAPIAIGSNRLVRHEWQQLLFAPAAWVESAITGLQVEVWQLGFPTSDDASPIIQDPLPPVIGSAVWGRSGWWACPSWPSPLLCGCVGRAVPIRQGID